MQPQKQEIQPGLKSNLNQNNNGNQGKTIQFEYLLKNNSEEKLIEELTHLSPGIETGYKIGDVELNFPGGGLSIIAAPTSHGKTSALINFSLGALQKNPDICTYFFSYEECSASILTSFINTWISKKLLENNINESISKNNRNSIDHYFRSEIDKGKYITKNVKHLFETYKKQFFETLINMGRLRIFYSDVRAEDLIESIRFIKQNTNVGLVCIDYIQLLNLKSETRSRQEALKEICLMLKNVAIETGLAIVIAAQFNRTVVCEADLSPVSIGEAGDIERASMMIIGMFNRNFQLHRDGNKDKTGNIVAKENAIYFEILKGRRTGNNHNCVMNFDGNRGIIMERNIFEKDINVSGAQRLQF